MKIDSVATMPTSGPVQHSSHRLQPSPHGSDATARGRKGRVRREQT
jgi:hypothetical protein